MIDIRYVWFDLDDTLLDHRGAESRALISLVDSHRHIIGDAPLGDIQHAYARINRRIWTEYAAGTRDKDGAKYGRFELLVDELNPSRRQDAAILADEYLRLYARYWAWTDGAQAALTHIARHRPVGILTNGFSEVQREKLQRFPDLTRTSAHVVISEEVGVLKPDIRLFQHAEALSGHSGRHVLYVGDSFSSDVTGGLGAGWHVAWFQGDEHDSPRVWTFHDWSELTTRLA